MREVLGDRVQCSAETSNLIRLRFVGHVVPMAKKMPMLLHAVARVAYWLEDGSRCAGLCKYTKTTELGFTQSHKR